MSSSSTHRPSSTLLEPSRRLATLLVAAALPWAAGCRDDVGLGGEGADLAVVDLAILVPDLHAAADLSEALPPDLAPPRCVDDRSCLAPTPRCDARSGRCVPCLPDKDNCDNGLHCLLRGGQYQCTTGCNVDGDCPGLPGAQVACVMDLCVLKACDPGRLDCDKQSANGCEIDGGGDLLNCGGCGTTCALPHATQSCKGGMCQIDRCEMGFSDCDGKPETGCETDIGTDVKNCGACGKVCGPVPNASPVCQGGACVTDICGLGFANCDKQSNNGCEVDLKSDVKNCGACGKVCMGPGNVALSCTNSVCKVGGCLPGFADCDGNPMNGCEPRPCASCMNGMKDGGESDVDCGGALCSPCAAGKECKGVSDCQSGSCSPGCCKTDFVCDANGCVQVCVRPCDLCDP